MGRLKYNIKYLLSKAYLFLRPLSFDVMSIEDTLKSASQRKSILRFGDGEFSLIAGENILFEIASKEITNRLTECLQATENRNILLCLPETLSDLSLFEKSAQKNWMINFADNHKYYSKYCKKDYSYGNAFLSRPYMAYSDKSHAEKCFVQLKSIFEGQDIFLIEGEYSRTGVGNDLFEGANSISRIVCPSRNAFAVLGEIKESAQKHIPIEALVLLALGPTSEPLGLDLANEGYWVIDIGHIDSEYEWFLRGAEHKVTIENKHTAEGADSQIGECPDPSYQKSIVDIIKG